MQKTPNFTQNDLWEPSDKTTSSMAESISIYPKQWKKLKFFSAKSWNWVQRVEIKLIVSLRWVKGLSIERQLLFNFFFFFFSVRMKNVQTEVNHRKPCNSYFSFIHCSAFWPTLQERNNKKQKPNSKMQNSWLTIKQSWEMSGNKSTFH